MKIFEPTKNFLNRKQWFCLSNKKYRLRQYFVLYTILFAFTCFVVFCWYFIPGRTFVRENDGWTQHYKALVYYAKYMRYMIREILYHHRFVFPEWDFSFGEGNDILQTLHYYVIGDPFSVFSVFVPTRFLWIYYEFMILFRLYLSGIAFSCLCFYTKKNIGRYAVMAGALSYVFFYWANRNATMHPFFLNPMLYFPLIILGIEKVLQKEKIHLLILSVFFAAISNFYFFYNIVLMTALYVAIRLITKYKTDFKSMLKILLRISGGSILGTVMGGIILLPVIFDFLSDTRSNLNFAWNLVYPLSYYSRLLGSFLHGDGNYWLCMGYAAPVILAIFLLFMRKKQHWLLKACFLSCLVIIFVPALGQILNGMSYMSNKWCWAFALLCTYIFSVMWSELMNLNVRDARKLAFALSVYFFGLLMLEYSRWLSSLSCIGVAFIFLLVIFPFEIESQQEKIQWKKQKQVVALALVIVAVSNVSFFKNAAVAGNEAKGALSPKDIEQLMLTEVKAIEEAAYSDNETGFYRYSGRSLSHNAGILYNKSSTNYYWSLANPAITLFRSTMELLEPRAYCFRGYDDRTALISLSAVKYYVVPNNDNAPIPYGFTYMDSFNVKKDVTEEAKKLLQDKRGEEGLSDAEIKVIENATASIYKVYRNENALPISYAYNAILSKEHWDKLSSVEKQEAMLQSVMLAEYDGETQDNAVNYSSRSLDYTIECNGTGITLEDYGFVVTSANASAVIRFEGLADSELYFAISGLDFDGVSTYELYFCDEKYDPLNLFSETRWNFLSYADQEWTRKNYLFWTEPTETNMTLKSSSGVSKTINYYTENHNWYSNRHDFTVNLDYTEDAVTSITVTFSAVGVYSFDSIEVICQPMNHYVEQVASLKKTTLKNIDIGTDTIYGNISLNEPKVLYFSIPYSEGWTAYVDEEKATLYQANIKNMALVLDVGEHSVKLVYHTPYLRIGAGLSAMGFIGFSMLLLIDIFRKRRVTTSKRRDSQ